MLFVCLNLFNSLPLNAGFHIIGPLSLPFHLNHYSPPVSLLIFWILVLMLETFSSDNVKQIFILNQEMFLNRKWIQFLKLLQLLVKCYDKANILPVLRAVLLHKANWNHFLLIRFIYEVIQRSSLIYIIYISQNSWLVDDYLTSVPLKVYTDSVSTNHWSKNKTWL